MELPGAAIKFNLLSTAKWRPCLAITMHMTGPLFRFIAITTSKSTVPTRAYYLQFVALVFPSLFSTFNFPLTLDSVVYIIPVDMATAWMLWLPHYGLCAELCHRMPHDREMGFLARCGDTTGYVCGNAHTIIKHRLFDEVHEVGRLLATGTLQQGQAPSCWRSCATLVLVSHSLVMLWALPWITSMVELQARRRFLRERGRSPDDVPWLVAACCEQGRWGWLVVVGIWAVVVAV